jgi:hypothetical protein
MKNPSRQPDLFGTPQPDLFQAMPQVPDHDTYVSLARTRLRAYLAQARSASRMPWPERDAEVIEDTYTTTAKWLPEPERAEICAALRSEFERLRRAA